MNDGVGDEEKTEEWITNTSFNNMQNSIESTNISSCRRWHSDRRCYEHFGKVSPPILIKKDIIIDEGLINK